MNRVIMSVCLMLAIISYSTAAAFIIGHENGELISVIDEISAYSEKGDSEKAVAAAELLSLEWYKYERRMSVLVRDDKLNTISASVARIKPYIEEANDELDAELQNISRQLTIIYRTELPIWYNIL